ncbi:MAG: hypothetical protein KDD06_11885, partial [Phaeodactylibacter sp.]|nr:hypothetical protein [Phaeodactylibacter sp.]
YFFNCYFYSLLKPGQAIFDISFFGFDLDFVQISMMSRKRGNFISNKANFAAGYGLSGEKFNTG